MDQEEKQEMKQKQEQVQEKVREQVREQEKRKVPLPDLFFTFARVGGLTFGGGVAMLPMLQKEIVENKKWATEEEMMDYYAIAQCTPGIIAVNCATFVGTKHRGVIGGIIATLGVVFPSLVIIMILAGLIAGFADLPAVRSAFAGIRVCVCVLVLSACIKLVKKAVIDIPTFILFLLITAGSYFLGISPVLYVLAAAGLGIVIKVLEGKKNG